MSVEDLRQRYLWIAKQSLSFLKDHGFKKKGQKYIKQEGDLLFEIYPYVTRPWINTDESYDFGFSWGIFTLEPKFIECDIFMGASKNIKGAYLMGTDISPASHKNQMIYLTNKDPADFDHKFAEGVKEEIETEILPLFDRINSLDAVIQITLEDEKLPRSERQYYKHTIYGFLAKFYAYKGWKDKALEMWDKDIEMTPATSRYLVEGRKKRCIKYFDQLKGI
ncbi:MAG: hypothetical protein JSR85_02685 [Proteobacteria bacterium]|nr:hypothetical protein [Pseudomonadota bacterium]